MIARFISFLIASILLVGCATKPQTPIPFSANTVATNAKKIGVTIDKVPTVDTFFPGASCLLCLAAASIANSELTAYAKTLSSDEFVAVKNDIVASLKQKGLDATLIDTFDVNSLNNNPNAQIDFSKKDFTSLKAKYGIDKLLVVHVTFVGFERPYTAYFPTGQPNAKLMGAGYIVNLNNNAYEWFYPFDLLKAPDSKWDEPPKFPSLTNAYFQVLEIGKDQITQQLSK